MVTIRLHPIVQLAFLVAFVQLSSATIAAQENAASDLITSLRTGNAQSVAAAIALLPDDALTQEDVVGQLTLLLNDERAIAEHLMSHDTVADRAWFRMLDLPSASVETILQNTPSLESVWARGRAFEVIARIGTPNSNAYSLLLPYCRDDDVYVRSRAIFALSAVAESDDESVEQFGKLLQDPDPMVKWTVLDALEKRHGHATALIPAIINLLDDDSDVYVAVSNHLMLPEKLHGRVARLLVKIGPAAVDAIPRLNSLTRPEFNKNVRIWAATAICRIVESPPPESLQLLGELLLDDMDREYVQNDAPEAIAELGTLANPLLEILERAKKHSAAEIRWGLVDAFFAVDPPSAVRRVLPMMKDENELVVETVIEAFSSRNISERAVIDAYILALGNRDGLFDQPASSALEALSKLGAAAIPAIPALEELRHDPEISDTLREEVERALAILR